MRSLVVVFPPDNPRSHMAGALGHLQRVLKDSDWDPKLVYLEDEPTDAGAWPWMAGGVFPKGVIWYYARVADLAMIESLAGTGVPVVTYNRDLRAIGASGVVADVTDVARRQFAELWDRGKRRFAVFGVERPSPSIRQYTQCVAAEAARRGVLDDLQQVSLAYSATQRPNERMMARIEHVLGVADDRPDAILCADVFSYRGLELWLATNRHVRVPEHLAVATFDRIPFQNTQRLSRQVSAAMMDEPRMLDAAIDLIERKLTGRLPVPEIVTIPAVMLDPAPAATKPRRPRAA